MSRPLKIILAVVTALAVIVVAALGYVGWVYSSELLTPPEAQAVAYDDTIVQEVDGELISLTHTDDAAEPGVLGLATRDGAYIQLLDIVEVSDGTVVRRFRPLEGFDEPRAGAHADIDGYALPEDPRRALGLAHDRVLIDAGVGDLPAWLVQPPGDADDTWAIFVHGRTATMREGLRLVEPLIEQGLPTLLVSYRNDDGAPDAPDGLYGLGSTEWRDVDAAIGYALDRGASDVVLAGASMGGSIVATTLHETDHPIVGLILDAPAIDWGAILALETDKRGLPSIFTWAAEVVTELRSAVDWGQLDQLARADEFDVPILLFHGVEDETVPVGSSDRFVDALGDDVTYVRVEGAGHVRAWNVASDRYEEAVADFVDRFTRP